MRKLIILPLLLLWLTGGVWAQDVTPTWDDKLAALKQAVVDKEVDALLINIAPNEYWMLTNLTVVDNSLSGTWRSPSEKAQEYAILHKKGKRTYLSKRSAAAFPILITVSEADFSSDKALSVDFKDIVAIHKFENKTNYIPGLIIFAIILVGFSQLI